MDFVRLEDDQRRAMNADGFLVVRKALDPAAVARASRRSTGWHMRS